MPPEKDTNVRITCDGAVDECTPNDANGTMCSTMPGGKDDQSSKEVCNGLNDDCDGTPPSKEICNGLDDNCNGIVGEEGFSVDCGGTIGEKRDAIRTGVEAVCPSDDQPIQPSRPQQIVSKPQDLYRELWTYVNRARPPAPFNTGRFKIIETFKATPEVQSRIPEYLKTLKDLRINVNTHFFGGPTGTDYVLFYLDTPMW